MSINRSIVRSWPRGALMALAMLALAVKVLVPPGFMLAEPGQGAGVVICTGHGAYVVDGPGDQKAPPAKSKADAPCAFAGNLTPPTPQVAVIARVLQPALSIEAPGRFADQAPGRGLAAPPPPALGPPVLV